MIALTYKKIEYKFTEQFIKLAIETLKNRIEGKTSPRYCVICDEYQCGYYCPSGYTLPKCPILDYSAKHLVSCSELGVIFTHKKYIDRLIKGLKTKAVNLDI